MPGQAELSIVQTRAQQQNGHLRSVAWNTRKQYLASCWWRWPLAGWVATNPSRNTLALSVNPQGRTFWLSTRGQIIVLYGTPSFQAEYWPSSHSQLSVNNCDTLVGAMSKPPPLEYISRGVNFFTGEETFGTPVVRVTDQRCGRSRPPALLRCWACLATTRQVRVVDSRISISKRRMSVGLFPRLDIFPLDIPPPGQFSSPPRTVSPAVKGKIWKLALTHTLDPNRPMTWGLEPNRPTAWCPDPNRPTGRRIIWKLTLTNIPDPNRYQFCTR